MQRYKVNAPGVVAEVIDGEAVIMNLSSGHYFSAQGIGALVWTELERGVTIDALATALATRYGIDSTTASTAIAAFIAQLEEHDLVATRADEEDVSAPLLDGAPAAWSAPQLNVFTDMEDLLLLDPIHDVGEAGWPMPKAPDSPTE